MKKILILLTLTYFFTQFLYSESQIIDNFVLDDISVVKGEGGRNFIQLKQNEYIPTPETDILLHFNSDNFTDSVGNYTVSSHYDNISSVEKQLGSSSAYFLNEQGIIFSSNGDTIFTQDRIIGDFTIEFWAYPTIISEDTTLFLWKGVNKVDADFIPQKIKCFIEDRNVVWEFENTFIPADFSNYTIKLKGKSRLIPNKWNHYMIRHNSNTGMLEFLLNGIPEAVKYSTKTEREDMTVYPPYIGNFSQSDIYIGEKFRGFIDELRISEAFIEDPQLSKFKADGSFHTTVYDINGENIIIENIKVKDVILSETSIRYKYRVSKIPFIESNTNIKWKEIDDISQEQNGRYIQFKGDFYSNGDNNRSPMLENIELIWNKILTPPAPMLVKTSSNKQKITVEWNPVKHYSIDGYYLYYGEASNNYTEMIDVGNKTSYTVEMLKSNKIYYFSLRSYINDKKSNYSLEVYNRPK